MDKNKILDLPKGFSCKIIGTGDQMSDGFYLPDKPDGMATFPSSKANEMILVSNHEINPGAPAKDGPLGNKNFRLEVISEDLIYGKGNLLLLWEVPLP